MLPEPPSATVQARPATSRRAGIVTAPALCPFPASATGAAQPRGLSSHPAAPCFGRSPAAAPASTGHFGIFDRASARSICFTERQNQEYNAVPVMTSSADFCPCDRIPISDRPQSRLGHTKSSRHPHLLQVGSPPPFLREQVLQLLVRARRPQHLRGCRWCRGRHRLVELPRCSCGSFQLGVARRQLALDPLFRPQCRHRILPRHRAKVRVLEVGKQGWMLRICRPSGPYLADAQLEKTLRQPLQNDELQTASTVVHLIRHTAQPSRRKAVPSVRGDCTPQSGCT